MMNDGIVWNDITEVRVYFGQTFWQLIHTTNYRSQC